MKKLLKDPAVFWLVVSYILFFAAAIFMLAFFTSCTKDEVCECENYNVKGLNYKIRSCDVQPTSKEDFEMYASPKQAQTMEERGGCR